MRLFGRLLNRKARRKVKAELSKPSFTREPNLVPLVTRVTDEVGQRWEAEGHHDLTFLGFIDNLKWAQDRGYYPGKKTPDKLN